MNKEKAVKILTEQRDSFLVGASDEPQSDYENWCLSKAQDIQDVIEWIENKTNVLFKAKPQALDYQPEQYDWVETLLDDDGSVKGYYVDGYLVGGFVEVNDEYTHLEWWIPIQKDTLQELDTYRRVK